MGIVKAAFLLLTWVSALVTGDSVPFEDCGFQFELMQVDVQGCSSVPCPMLHNTYTNVSATFITTSQSNTLRSDVRITILAVSSTASTVPSNPCEALVENTCPLASGLQVEHRAAVLTPSLVPTRGTLQWRLYDHTNTEVLCFRVAVIIVENGLTESQYGHEHQES